MYTQEGLSNLLLFDIESASSTELVTELSPRLQKLWAKRAEYLRAREKNPENKVRTDEDLYAHTAGLQAEFGRVICVNFGMIRWEGEQPKLIQKSIHGTDEVDVLTRTFAVMEKSFKSNPLVKLCGHNVKRFDIPFLGKRAMINGLDLPKLLENKDKKPWELPVVDTCELWSFGAWQEGFTGLDLIAACLGLPSPKDEMDGSQVSEAFWNGYIEQIAKYCGKDVLSLAQILLKLSKKPDLLVEEAV